MKDDTFFVLFILHSRQNFLNEYWKLKTEKWRINLAIKNVYYQTDGDTMKENILIDKSIDFGARIVKLRRYLTEEKHESVLSKQILRSGTSIGANINEAQYGSSKADFIAKLHIALKETAETEYWLHILEKSDYLDSKMASSMLSDCLEIKRILIASIKTAKE